MITYLSYELLYVFENGPVSYPPQALYSQEGYMVPAFARSPQCLHIDNKERLLFHIWLF